MGKVIGCCFAMGIGSLIVHWLGVMDEKEAVTQIIVGSIWVANYHFFWESRS